jgi:hypothetical protein
MNDERLYLSEVSADRTVKDELSPEEQAWAFKGDNNVVYGWVGQRFTLRMPVKMATVRYLCAPGKSFMRIFGSVWQYRFFMKPLTGILSVKLLPYALL